MPKEMRLCLGLVWKASHMVTYLSFLIDQY